MGSIGKEENTMKKLSIGLKQVVVLIVILTMTMASCFALTGCGKTDDSNESVQIEDEVVVVEEEPDDFA